MNWNELHERFVKEKKFLLGVTPKTERWYRIAWRSFIRMVGTPEVLDRFVLNDFVIKLRESGIKPRSCNSYIGAINSFLTWLWENNIISERLKIKDLKEEQPVMPTYTKEHLTTFLNCKPKTWTEKRMYALVCTLIDTGARIDIELLPLKREDVDFENLLIRLKGKGGKERLVPMSLELRKILYRWLQTHEFEIVFPTRDGCKQGYRNTFRDFEKICKRLNIPCKGFHCFRHTFATEYLRNGGGELYLQRALGHSTLTMTRRYAQINEEDLKVMHKRTSILSRLK
jgi:integrase/recombinase XerD